MNFSCFTIDVYGLVCVIDICSGNEHLFADKATMRALFTFDIFAGTIEANAAMAT